MPAVTVRCPAKLNLTLAVGPPDPNHPTHPAYHPVASFMSAIDLCDTLTIEPADATSYEIAFADDAPLRQPVDWSIERDLSARAHWTLEQHIGHALPARLVLSKRVPAGAGLGGGSADAAGALHAINEAFNLGLTMQTLQGIAATLGSDVAFALQAITGSPHAIATGFGETLHTVHPAWNTCDATLLLPPFGCPTALVYRAFDDFLKPTVIDRGLLPDLHDSRCHRVAEAPLLTNDLLFNDLTPAAMTVQPALHDIFDALRQLDHTPHLTGSGSAVFVLGREADRKAMQHRTGCAVIPIRIG